jgi:hypothetical protein
MPTPKPLPSHGALGERPPRDADTTEQAVAPPDYETDDDLPRTEDELPEGLPASNS